MKYTIACFDDAEGVMALYEGDERVMEGDYYHNKIDSLIEGFFLALEHLKISYDCVSIDVKEFDAVYGPDIPITLSEVMAHYETDVLSTRSFDADKR